jgi:hypothetical protein
MSTFRDRIRGDVFAPVRFYTPFPHRLLGICGSAHVYFYAASEVSTLTALQKKNWVKPYKLHLPFRVEINFTRSSMADMAELIPQVKRVNPRTVRFVSENFIEGFKLMRAIMYMAR